MKKTSWRLLPSTAWGKGSIILIVAMPLLFSIGASFTKTLYAGIPAGESILADIAARPALALTMLAGMICGISAFVLGFLAINKQKDRSLLVCVSTIIGALLILFLSGELLFPH